MEPIYSMMNSQGLSSNPYSELNQPNSSYPFKIHSNIALPSSLILGLFFIDP
jgi:hypothetical protein